MVVQMVPVGSSRERVVEDGWMLGTIEVDSNRRFVTKVERINRYDSPIWFDDRGEAEAHILSEGRQLRDRWQRALDRAVAAGLDPLELAGDEDAWAVESGSRPGLAYLVRGRRAQQCSCPAGQAGDAVCQHRAAVLAALGIISPAPTTERCPVTGEAIDADGFYTSTCRECSGMGKTWFAWGREACSRSCEACGGTGRKIAA